MTPDHMRELALIQISQSQRNAAMQPAPLYFIHGKRVVRGALKHSRANHRLEVQALNYVLPDGSDQPIPLDFKRVLKHSDITGDAAPLLALVKPKRRRK